MLNNFSFVSPFIKDFTANPVPANCAPALPKTLIVELNNFVKVLLFKKLATLLRTEEAIPVIGEATESTIPPNIEPKPPVCCPKPKNGKPPPPPINPALPPPPISDAELCPA